ncbi:MAG: hypothetical protein IJ829_08925 [Kiritimatiellae bacterium]|nr:hypothetical protein [Kiritimatiellia bacterium]
MNRMLATALSLLVCGCAAYSWRSGVPAEMRTVSVSTFRNESDLTELGAVAARQVLREFQREGTFKIASADDAALEVQGVVKSADLSTLDFRRETASRAYEHVVRAVAEVTLVDRRSGKVLFDNRKYTAETTFFGDSDVVTGRRGAAGRLGEELARQIVDDVVAYKWN